MAQILHNGEIVNVLVNGEIQEGIVNIKENADSMFQDDLATIEKIHEPVQDFDQPY